MKQTAVEWLEDQIKNSKYYFKLMVEINSRSTVSQSNIFEQAKEMEKKQLFLSSSISPKEAYKAGQKTMECGCYDISDATTYEEWLYEQFKEQ